EASVADGAFADPQDGSVGSLVSLAEGYSRYYGTSLSDVCERMEELRRRKVVQDAEMSTVDSVTSLQLRSQLQTGATTPEKCSHVTQTNRSVMKSPLLQESLGLRSSSSTPETERREAGRGGADRSGRVSVTDGETPISKGLVEDGEEVGFVASEITMSDEERIQLMMMVKENMISIEEALARLKEFEVQNRPPPEKTCSPVDLSEADPEDSLSFKRLQKLVTSSRRKRMIRSDENTKREECPDDEGPPPAGGSSPREEAPPHVGDSSPPQRLLPPGPRCVRPCRISCCIMRKNHHASEGGNPVHQEGGNP
ncbi:hypothetical protein KUCAC02_037154, partial [Chaenocephalus aceratus]